MYDTLADYEREISKAEEQEDIGRLLDLAVAIRRQLWRRRDIARALSRRTSESAYKFACAVVGARFLEFQPRALFPAFTDSAGQTHTAIY